MRVSWGNFSDLPSPCKYCSKLPRFMNSVTIHMGSVFVQIPKIHLNDISVAEFLHQDCLVEEIISGLGFRCPNSK